VRLQEAERSAAEQKGEGDDRQPDDRGTPAWWDNETARGLSAARPEAVAGRRVRRSPQEIGLMMGEIDRCVKEVASRTRSLIDKKQDLPGGGRHAAECVEPEARARPFGRISAGAGPGSCEHTSPRDLRASAPRAGLAGALARVQSPCNPERRGGLRSHTGSKGRTYAQLRNEARERGIKGRSKMSKAQLQRAVDAKKR
jgi:hypothetical protein